MLFNLFRNKEKELEKAKTKLVYELENNGIENLVKQMGNNEVYSPIIGERREKELSWSSTDLVSWYAYRASEKLSNPEIKTRLIELLADKEYNQYRRYIFSCLANLCSNTSDYRLYDFLICNLEKEDDENIIISVLSQLETLPKPKALDMNFIKHLAKEGSYNTQRAAIKALSLCEDDEVEDLLLEEFKISDRQIQSSICVPLRSVGTNKAIPILKDAHKKTRDYGLKGSIEYTIAEIEKREKGL